MMKNRTNSDLQIPGESGLSIHIWTMKDRHTYDHVNSDHAMFVGASADKLLSHGVKCIPDQEVKSKLQSTFKDVFRSPSKHFCELYFHDSSRALALTITPLYPGDELEGIMFTAYAIQYTTGIRPKPLTMIPDILTASLKGMRAAFWHWNVQSGETNFDDEWARIVGYTLEELSPVSIETWERLTHPDDLEIASLKLNDHFSGKTDTYSTKLRMKHKQGHWVWVRDRGAVYEWSKDGKPLYMAGTHIDITEKQELELLISKQDELQRLANNFSVDLMQAQLDRFDATVEIGLGTFGDFLNTDRVYIFKMDPDKRLLSNTHEWVADGVHPEKNNLQDLPYDAFPWWMSKIEANETIYIKNVGEIPDNQSDLRDVLQAQDIKSLLVVPIQGHQEAIGFMGFDFVGDFWDLDEFIHKVLLYVSSIIAGALESRASRLHIMDLFGQERDVFKYISEETKSIIMITDQNQKINYVNPAHTETYKYSPDELMHRAPRSMFATNIGGSFPHQESVNTALARDGRWEGNFLNLAKDGTPIYESATISPKYDIANNVTGYIKIAENVTFRKKNNFWSHLINLTHQLYLEFQNQPNFFNLGMAAQVLCLKDMDTILSSHTFWVISNSTISENPLHTAYFQQNRHHERDAETQLTEDECDALIQNETIYNLASVDTLPLSVKQFLQKANLMGSGELIVSPIQTDSSIFGVLGFMHNEQLKYFDLSDLANLNKLGDILGRIFNSNIIQRLVLAQNRQEQVSELASGLAHEVRNPLAIISLGMEVINKDLDLKNPRVTRVKTNIDRSIVRANKIVENLMRLGTPVESEAEPSSLNLKSILEDALELITFHAREKRVTVINNLSTPVNIYAVRESLLKVLVNVLLNAVQAVPQLGEIKICQHGQFTELVFLEVKDNGPGISPENLARVTRPFFTTKKETHGSGMGLYICEMTMKRLGGTFEIKNRIPHGVTVQIGLVKAIDNIL